MSIVNDELLLATYAGVKTNFQQSYDRALPTAQWPLIASEIPTTLPVQNYAFLGRGLVIERLKDRPRQQGVNPYPYFVRDDVYEGVLTIERTALEDDQVGLIQMKIDGIGEEAVRAWERLVFKGLDAGKATVCYDGQYFFDTDHPDPSTGGQVSNISTNPLSSNGLQAADAAMRKMKDDKGEPMGIVPDTLVVGPNKAFAAWELVGSPVVVVRPGDGAVGTGATAATPYGNVFQGRYRVVVSEYILDDDWYLLDTKRSVKPLFIQSRSDVGWDIGTDSLEFGARFRNEYNYGIRGRYGLGYGLWQAAYAGNPS